MTIRILLTIIVAAAIADWAIRTRSAAHRPIDANEPSLTEATSVPRPATPFVGPTRPVSLPDADRFADLSPADHQENDHQENQEHWAFQPLNRPVVPTSRHAHPIDAFLTGKPTDKTQLAGNATAPVTAHFDPPSHGRRLLPHADPRTLVRRLWFDVVGLPPTIDDIDALKHGHLEWEDLVDDLLQRPQFGERWARHWLDIARYADSNGYEYDEVRWNAYPYRDWVIRAINDDLPYDDFVRWQIAGDELLEHELSDRSVDAMTATGFLVAGPHNTFFPQEVERYDELDDIVQTVGQAFLGLSIGCARCHDHMTEPISQREYYQLVGVFQSTKRADRYLAPDHGRSYLDETAELREAQARLYEILEIAARDAKIDDLDEDLFSEADKELLKAPLDADNERQAKLVRDAGTRLQVYDEDLEAAKPRDEHQLEYNDLVDLVEELVAAAPPEPATTLAIDGSGAAPCWVLENGDVAKRGDAVEPGFLECVGNSREMTWQACDRQPEGVDEARPRSAFAFWITDVEGGAGALVARVAVNRIWQHYFGRGLVATPSNFGLSGEAPTHRALLDYLASELVEHDWSMKHIHRLILTSECYQQSGVGPSAIHEHEESYFVLFSNDNLAYPLRPRRLDAEVVRDAVYATSGRLNKEMFGPPIQPPIPCEAVLKAGEQDDDTWPRDAIDGEANWRRSIYIQHRRSNPFPLLALFGKPEAGTSCAARTACVVPTQTLAMWNEPWLRRQAAELASTLSDNEVDPVIAAYRRVLQREPSDRERLNAEALISDVDLASLIHVLLVSNEFLYVD